MEFILNNWELILTVITLIATFINRMGWKKTATVISRGVEIGGDKKTKIAIEELAKASGTSRRIHSLAKLAEVFVDFFFPEESEPPVSSENGEDNSK